MTKDDIQNDWYKFSPSSQGMSWIIDFACQQVNKALEEAANDVEELKGIDTDCAANVIRDLKIK